MAEYKWRASLCIAALVASNGVYAQTAATDQTAVSSEAESRNGQIQDIIVTARRSSENLQKVPIAITALGSEALEQRSILEVGDLQGQAPSLFLIAGTGGSAALSVSIRGITSPEPNVAQTPTVGVYVDDVVLPSNIGLRTSFFDVEQVAVLKGPQGTLFGKNSTSGAIQITTRKPTFAPEGYVEASYGSYKSLTLGGAVSGPIISDKMAFRVAVQSADRDGFGEDRAGNFVDSLDSTAVRAQLLTKFSDTVELLLQADSIKIRNQNLNSRVVYIVPQTSPLSSNFSRQVAAELGLDPTVAANRVTGYNAFRNAAFCGASFYDGCGTFDQVDRNDLRGVSGTLTADLGFATFKSITADRYVRRYNAYEYDGTPFTVLHPPKDTKIKSFTQEFQLTGDAGRLDWTVGAFYNRQTGFDNGFAVQFPRINPTSPTINENSLTNTTKAVYAQGVFALTDRFRVTGGLRYTDEGREGTIRNRNALGCIVPVAARPPSGACEATITVNGDNLSWLASIDWQATDNVMLFAKAARGFRAGGVPTTGTSTAALVPFDQENLTEYEVGFKSDLIDRRLRINGSVFYDDYKGLQRAAVVATPTTTVNIVTNAATATIQGAELEVEALPTDNLSISANFAYVDAEYGTFIDVTGDRSNELFPQPKYTFAVNGLYTVPLAQGPMRFSANYRWQDTVVLRPTAANISTVTQKAYGLLDGRISMEFDDSGIELAASVRNALAKKYYTGGLDLDKSLGYNLMFTGEPRIFSVSIRKTW
jgi:iron complex outermembrane receptor protein